MATKTNEPQSYENCITEEIQSHKSRTLALKDKNDIYEANKVYIVTKTYIENTRKVNGMKFHRVKDGEKIPEGAKIHYGKI